MRDEKEERSKHGQNKKTKQHSTHKAVTFPKKNELSQVGLEPTTLYTLDRALYQLSYEGCSAGWAQISHLRSTQYDGEGWGTCTCHARDCSCT